MAIPWISISVAWSGASLVTFAVRHVAITYIVQDVTRMALNPDTTDAEKHAKKLMAKHLDHSFFVANVSLFVLSGALVFKGTQKLGW